MIEVSLSPFFSVYFGLLFLVFGLMIFYQVRRRSRAGSFTSRLLSAFGGLMLLGGVSCFALDEQWFSWGWILKVPFYSLLGTSVTFCFVFSLVDVINVCVQRVGGKGTLGLVTKPMQVYVLLAA